MTDINLSRLHRWGEGIFTTLLIRSGRPVNLQAHLHRLHQAGLLLGLRPEINGDTLVHQISRLCHGTDCILRVEISLPDEESGPPVLSLSARPLPGNWQELPDTGVALLESSMDYSPPFRDVKWVKWNAFQPWSILRRELTTEWDVIVTDGSQWLETTRAGLIARNKTEWYVQQKSGKCLQSTTINALAVWLQSKGESVQEAVFTPDFAARETSWFVANAVIGLVPVHSIHRRGGGVDSFPTQPQPANEFRTWYLNQLI